MKSEVAYDEFLSGTHYCNAPERNREAAEKYLVICEGIFEMKDNYISEINRMVAQLDIESDAYFIRQIYAILYRHEEKKMKKPDIKEYIGK